VLTLTVARVIEKRDKGARVMLLNGILVEEELQKRKEAEARKARQKIDGSRTIHKYRTIKVGDTRLKVIARDEAMERQIELHNL
jgi:hypothetical protein